MRHLQNPLPRLCFMSYSHLSNLARSVVTEFAGRAEIDIVEAAFEAAQSIARERATAGAVDVFVSAGSNAALIREAVDVPVAVIKPGGYDILQALLQARTLSDRVGVVSYGATIPELDAVRDVLKIEIVQLAYRSAAQARECFHALTAQGCGVIVGSSIVVELAQQHGLAGILAYSAASVRESFEDALEMARVGRLEAQRYAQVNAVLSSLKDAVLAVDAAGRITAVNPAMMALLGLPRLALVGRVVDDIEPALALAATVDSGEEQRSQVVQLAGRDWVANRTPIREGASVVGAVVALSDADAIEEAGSSLRAQRKRRKGAATRYTFADLQGASPAFVQALAAARRYAATDLTVLVIGESGTGKELVAQAMHAASPRASRPFIALNCAALPEALLESELFGYEDGTFTGARRGGRRGLFEAADTGTLFLDEIGDMPLPLQTRLLRALQEREVTRLGSSQPTPVDVRVIAATHQLLAQRVQAGLFRADLFYRLNALRLVMPPLRQRADDIASLARDLLGKALERLQSKASALAIVALLDGRLQQHDWPGNVRELENLCQRLALFFADAPVELSPRLVVEVPELFAAPAPSNPRGVRSDATVADVLARCGGNRQEAARQLGISRATLWRRLRETSET